jgi:hypothetical protein
MLYTRWAQSAVAYHGVLVLVLAGVEAAAVHHWAHICVVPLTSGALHWERSVVLLRHEVERHCVYASGRVSVASCMLITAGPMI